MNSAFGEPRAVNMPFDMRHLRNPITYYLDDAADYEERSRIKANLVKDLCTAFETIIRSGILNQPAEVQKEFDGTPITSNPSTFLQPGETFLDNRLFRPGTKELIIPDVQRLFLRLIPRTPANSINSSKTALDFARSGGLVAMGEQASGWSYGRNKYGAYACSEENGKITGLTQLFKSGELWGIDTECIEKNGLMERAKVEFGFFPCFSFERTFVWTLANYLKFVRDTLNLPLPLKFVAGATDVIGYRMTSPSGMSFGYKKFGGNVVEANIIFNGMIRDYSEEPSVILRPFFEHVWEECGLERPDRDILS